MRTSILVRAALTAALYVTLTALLAPVSFGALQFRVAEALVVLPVLFPETILGLYIGCILANIIGGLGPWDVWFGSFATLVAACGTYLFRRSWLAYASPIVINALLVSIYLAPIVKMPYWLTAGAIAVSEAVVVVVLGVPFIAALRRSFWQ